MNSETVLAIVLTIAFIILVDILCRREIKRASVPQEARPWRYFSWAMRLIIVVMMLVIIASQMDIPNPFAPASDESSPASGFSRNITDDKLTVPPTNANPAKAAEDNRKLLEEARSQQEKP